MALKIVLPALLLLLLLVCCASKAQGQEAGVSLPLVYNGRAVLTDFEEDLCPNNEILEDVRERISTDIQSDLQEKILPSILLSEGWTRVAYLDMTNTSHQCPSGWQTYTTPTRACGRNFNGASCRSVFYPTNGVSYSHVCGRVIAYQYCYTDAFDPYNNIPTRTINDIYVDGISITHGSPRQHVWTFAAAWAESYTGTDDWTCPCTNVNNNDNPNIRIPPFVGDDYYCDTGTFTFPSGGCSSTFFVDDPLWDGAGCGSTNTCCELNNPPWFCKTLPVFQPVTDDIEVRICGDESSTNNEDTPVELIEIYVF